MRSSDDLDRVFDGLLNEKVISPRLEALNTLTQPIQIAEYLKFERSLLFDRILGVGVSRVAGRPGICGISITHEFSDLMDAVMHRIFTLACDKVGVNPTTLPIAIVATGGYGRRELAAYSDIDVTFIPQRDGDPAIDRLIREMFSQLMDICIARCGLEVGYAYRLFEDCGKLDHQTACGLLDARLIIGANRLFIQFEDAFWMGFNPPEFIFSKIEERDAILEKYGRSPRGVEPNLKEGAGGLRDLQTAVWLTQANHQLNAARVRGERSFEALRDFSEVSKEDVVALAEAKELVFLVRNTLHALVGRERDELAVTRQEEVARLLGYADDPELKKFQGQIPISSRLVPPVEIFMGDLFRALALIRRVADQIIRRVGNSRHILGLGIDSECRRVVPSIPPLYNYDPNWLLWIFELPQRYNLELSELMEREAVSALVKKPEIRDMAEASEVFTTMLSRLGKVYPTLQKMADLGILGWLLPEFGALMDLIPYDPSHDHTVGQHTLLVIKNLEALLKPENDEEAEMGLLLRNLPHPEYLMMAVLIHDAGKATPGRPHSEIGTEIVEVVCRRLGWGQEGKETVKFLVGNHLIMAETSRLRDTNREDTIREFTEQVNDIDRLNMLYLLTYADTRAVGEGVWTQVKGRFLSELWRRSLAVLSDEEPIEMNEATLARARNRLFKNLSLDNLPEEEVSEHIQSMPPNYLLSQSQKQMAMHIGFVKRVREGEPVVDFLDERASTFTELTVCTYDDPQPGLLAKIAGVLYAADLNVHNSEVITRRTKRDTIALDTLWADYRGRQLTAGKHREVTANLTKVLKGELTVAEILARKRPLISQKTNQIDPEPIKYLTGCIVQHQKNEALSVVELRGPDVPGVFYRYCEAFARLGWDIQSAKVSTWHGQARIAFYLTGVGDLPEIKVRDAIIRSLPVE